MPSGTGDGVRVLIVDDQDAFRCVLGELIGATPGFTLVAEASSGEEALSAREALAPDLAVVDLRMPGMDGVQTARALLGRDPHLAVLLVSAHAGPEPGTMSDACPGTSFVCKGELCPDVLREVWDRHRRADAAA
jgi:CheY-like chemotaxis protein